MKNFLFLWAFLLPVFGGLNTGWSPAWGQVSEDQSRILVILPVSMMGDTEEHSYITLPDGRKIYLREHFDTSGVYDLASMDLLWKIDSYTVSRYSMICNDDFSLMAVWSGKNFSGSKQGLNFFNNGELIKFYEQGELYTHFSKWYFLPPDWMHELTQSMEVAGDILVFVTPKRGSPSFWGWREIGYWETYTFDMKTGEILSLEIEDSKTKRIIAVILAGLILIIGSIIGIMIWLNRRAKPS